jgi:hypothetical protein
MRFEVVPLTILGSRIRYGRQNEKVSTVIADARTSLRVFHGQQLQRECELLIEIDRGTYSLTKLEDRLQKYRDLFRDSNHRFDLLLMFPNQEREENALQLLRSLSLEAWTVTENRLALPVNSDWWLQNPYLGSELPRDSTGGFSPWRSIWNNSISPDSFSMLLNV